MRNKAKTISGLAVALCALVMSAFALGACGADYSTYTYGDYAKMTDADWNKKEISYQCVSPTHLSETSGMLKQFLFNVYSDGTALIWQAGLYTTGAKDANWFDEERHVSWAYFGRWETDENENIQIYYMASQIEKNSADTVVEMNEEWVDVTNHKFRIQLTKTDDGYVLDQSTGVFYYYMLTESATCFELVHAQPWAFKSGSDIECPTLQDFVDLYIDGPFDRI